MGQPLKTPLSSVAMFSSFVMALVKETSFSGKVYTTLKQYLTKIVPWLTFNGPVNDEDIYIYTFFVTHVASDS